MAFADEYTVGRLRTAESRVGEAMNLVASSAWRLQVLMEDGAGQMREIVDDLRMIQERIEKVRALVAGADKPESRIDVDEMIRVQTDAHEEDEGA